MPDCIAMETVGFEHMVDGTVEDYEILGRELAAHKANHLADHILGTLKAMAGPLLGYPVDRFEHSLQSATRALRNDESNEMVLRRVRPELLRAEPRLFAAGRIRANGPRTFRQRQPIPASSLGPGLTIGPEWEPPVPPPRAPALP